MSEAFVVPLGDERRVKMSETMEEEGGLGVVLCALLAFVEAIDGVRRLETEDDDLLVFPCTSTNRLGNRIGRKSSGAKVKSSLLGTLLVMCKGDSLYIAST